MARKGELIQALRGSKNYIFFALILYVLVFAFAFMLPSTFTFFDMFIQSFDEKTSDLNTFEFIFFIALNNISNAFFVIVSGLFFGVIPLVETISNGALFGYVSVITYFISGSFSFLWIFVPHGIFELPATFIAFGLGMWIGFGFVGNYFRVNRKNRTAKILGAMAFGFALFGMGWTTFFATVIPNGSFLMTLIFRLLFLAPFIFLFTVRNKKLKNLNKTIFHERFYGSLKILLYIIVPLMIIAAVVEGLVVLNLR